MTKYKNFLFFYSSNFFYAIIIFLSLSFIAKNIDINNYGQVATILTLCTFFLPFVTLKIDQGWLKEVNENHNDEKFAFYFKKVINYFLFLSIPIFILFSFISNYLLALIFVFYFFSIMCLEFINTYYLKRKIYRKLNTIFLITSFFRVLLIIFFFFFPSIFNSHLFIALFVLPIFLYSIAFVKRIFQVNIKKKFIFKFQKTKFFFFSSVLSYIYFQSDILMLSMIKGEKLTAYYHVSFICIMAVYSLPSALFQKFLLPSFHEIAINNKKNIKKIIIQNEFKVFVLSIFICSLTFILSGPLINFFFSEKYNSSINLLYILSLAIPFYYMAFLYGAYLTTKNFLRTKVKYMFNTAILNILLNLLLIPKYGAYGASFATLFSTIFLFAFYRYGFKKL